jgi:ATP-binding protein involved in chromosome partitioning
VKNVIAIAAGKGGVGKSTVTVNLARALLSVGLKVGILDADIYGPSLRRMLPEDRLPSQKGNVISPALSQGIKYISMAYFRKDHEASVVRAPIANGVINQFITGVEWGELDYLLIDFPPGTGDIQLTLAQKAYLTGALLVTTPQEVAVMDVRKAAKMFDIVKIPVLGVVENMSFYVQGDQETYPFGQGGGLRLARELGIPLVGKIPLDSSVSASGDAGAPLQADSKVAAEFSRIAEEIMRHINHLKNEKSDILALASASHGNGESLEIQWKSHGIQQWTAAELQKNCPCANCVDDQTGQRRTSKIETTRQVAIRNVNRVGRYAIQIEFINGCSTGIFDFDYLRTIPTLIRS